MREFLVIFVKTVESLKTFLIFFALMFTTFTSTMIILIKNYNKVKISKKWEAEHGKEDKVKLFYGG